MTFASLPTELLLQICNELHPAEGDPPSGGLGALASLARATRRVTDIVESVLYDRGVNCHSHLPLAWAAQHGLIGTLEKALAAGASPNYRFCVNEEIEDEDETTHVTFYEHTALHFAAREGHTDIVSRLLDHGALPEALAYNLCDCQEPVYSIWQAFFCKPVDEYYWGYRATPLHLAMCSSQSETAKVLAAALGTRATDGLDDTQVKKLLEETLCGTTVPLVDEVDYWTREADVHWAAAEGHADVLDAMLNAMPGFNINGKDEYSLTAFYRAYANGRWDSTIPVLIAHGANIDETFDIEFEASGSITMASTPLVEACHLERYEDAIRLIDLGADVTFDVHVWFYDYERSPWGEWKSQPPLFESHLSVLHICCMDLDESYDDTKAAVKQAGWQPGTYAKQANHLPELIAKLIAAGVSPDARWDIGNGQVETPLSVAVRFLKVPALKALLSAGADANACDPHGRNALMLLILYHIHTHECFFYQCGPSAVNSDDEVRWWRTGFVPCQSGSHHLPLREMPYDRSKPELARLLLDAGTRVNAQDSDGNTALHHLLLTADDGPIKPTSPSAMSRDDLETARVLLSSGADLCIRNHAGLSALQLAAESNSILLKNIILEHVRREGLSTVLGKEDLATIKAMAQDTGTQYGEGEVTLGKKPSET